MLQGTTLVLVIAAVSADLAVVRVSSASEGGVVRAPSAPFAPADSVFGVFEGRTPCGRVATEFTGFPAQNCEKINWRLILYRDPVTGRPSSYRYQGTPTEHHGQWRETSGGGPERGWLTYRLTPAGSAEPLSLLSIDDKVLLLLDRTGQLVVGDASWSYALNRVDPPRR